MPTAIEALMARLGESCSIGESSFDVSADFWSPRSPEGVAHPLCTMSPAASPTTAANARIRIMQSSGITQRLGQCV
jgi:hypothetical protein